MEKDLTSMRLESNRRHKELVELNQRMMTLLHRLANKISLIIKPKSTTKTKPKPVNQPAICRPKPRCEDFGYDVKLHKS